jgi:uncharacterized protein involved in exopolysaccharide biosynthesis
MKTLPYDNLPSPPRHENENSLRDILTILFRHQTKMVLFFISVVTIVTITTFLLPEIYQSDARLLIKLGRESVSVDPAVMGPTISVSQSRQNEINSELAILNSRFLAEAVVNDLGTEYFTDEDVGLSDKNKLAGIFSKVLAFTKHFIGSDAETSDLATNGYTETNINAIKQIIANLGLTVEKDSNIINLSFTSESPKLAHDVLQSLLRSYQGHHIKVHKSQASPHFFQVQSEKLLAALNEKEEQLKRFRIEHDIVSIDFQREEMLSNINQLQNEITTIRTQISSSKAKIRSLGNALKKNSKTIQLSKISGGRNPAADQIKARLIDLRLEENDLSSRYPDDYRLLIDLRQQIKLAENALVLEERTMQAEVRTGIDTNYQAIELLLETERSQLQADMAREKTLNTELAQRKKELTRIIGYETQLNGLDREVNLLKGNYLKYTDNFQRAKISAALDMDNVSNVSIVQPPTLPFEPIKPKKRLNLAFGIFLGIFGGIGLAFVQEFFDDTLKTNEDIEKRLELPVLATISKKDLDSCI